MVLPCANSDLRAQVSQAKYYDCEISEEIERQLVELFDAEIALLRKLEENKLRLNSCPHFVSSNAFSEILLYSSASYQIDRRGIELYLCAKGYTPEVEVVDGIIRRIDVNSD
jgi:hypothetical protein